MHTEQISRCVATLAVVAAVIACGPTAPVGQQGQPPLAPNTPVVIQNPGQTPVPLPDHCECGVYDAGANAIGWTVQPVIKDGVFTAQGTVAAGMRLSDPMAGEPPAFMVHYGDNTEVLLVLLPDLAPSYIWDTDHTVAPTDIEQTGNDFELRAYSPLFMDVGDGDYRLVVWGYDTGGKRVMLSVLWVGVE